MFTVLRRVGPIVHHVQCLRGDTQNETMNLDKISDILRNPVRRQTVAVLDGKNDISRDRLIDVLATAEADDTDDAEQIRRRVRIELHHNHLPRLADAGLIEYDEETVAATSRLETVAQSPLSQSLSLSDGDQARAQT